MLNRTILQAAGKRAWAALLACSALWAQAAHSHSCFPLTTDRITGKDLAKAIPQMAPMAAQVEFGYAPAPGAERVFRPADLRRWATQYGVTTDISEPVCFAWPMHALTQAALAEVMRKSLSEQDASLLDVQIEITDQYRGLVPDGELNFPRANFSGETDQPAVWPGFVLYGGNRKFNTWARVRITVREKHILATRSIAAGERIEAADLKAVDYEGPLRRSQALQTEAAAIGQSARWPLAAGVVLTKNVLVPPLDVEKEQLVAVHIDSGAAHIETQGIAAEEGYKGNVIRIRNPKTGRVFRARIDAPGVVTVVPGGQTGLVVEEKKS